MKKIVLFIGGLKFGGMERVAFITAELLREDFDVTIATLYQTDAEYSKLANSYDLNVPPKEGKINKLLVAINRLIATKRMKKALSPDIVWSFGMYSNYMNALTKGKEKIIMGVRSYDWFTKPFLNKKIDSFVVSKFDSVNSVSKLIARDISIYWSVKGNKSRVIYNPYDVDYIKRLGQDSVDDFTFNNECFYYISMGRLSNQKGFNHLIKAFHLAHEGNKKVRLLILGNGELLESLNQLVKQLHLENCVYLLGGKKNPYKYVSRCNAYVLSSLAEGFPNALVEAMALSVPVVSTDCESGPREILAPATHLESKVTTVTQEEYGILVPPVLDNYNFDPAIMEQCDITLAEGMNLLQDDAVSSMYKKKLDIYVRKYDYESYRNCIRDELNSVF